jgi:predicted enzyme related to lactoylglutathione lyase
MTNHKQHDQRIDYIELPASDVLAAKKFYSAVFGYTYQDWGPDYADANDGRLSHGLTSAGSLKAPLVVMHAVDLEAARHRVLEAGGKILREIFSFPGGRRFHFSDPHGNELAVWGPEKT